MNALITGSSRGIGLAIARAIGKAGGNVMITGRNASGIDEAVSLLKGTGVTAIGTVMDVTDVASVSAAVKAAEREFTTLDVVVNNAGVGRYGDIAAFRDEDWRDVMETNVTGAFHVMRAAIPALKRAGGGWIINIASLAGANPFAGGGAYCASKAALIALSDAAMLELRQENIRVSVVLPGSVATRFSSRSAGDDTWKLSPDDVAEAVMGLLRHPGRSLPSRIEIRPSRPKKS
jgi:3-oxoacyl-[acyl-carrier protein] reductase